VLAYKAPPAKPPAIPYGVFIGPGRAPFRVRLTHMAASGDFALPRCVIHAAQYRSLTGVDPQSLPDEPGVDPHVTVALRELSTSTSTPREFHESSTLELSHAQRDSTQQRERDAEATTAATGSRSALRGASARAEVQRLMSGAQADEYTSPSEGEYRAGFTFAQCVAFVREEDRNPKTGRPIERFGPTWRSLNQAAVAWRLRSCPAPAANANENTRVAHEPTPVAHAPTPVAMTVRVMLAPSNAQLHAVMNRLRSFLIALQSAPTRPHLIVIERLTVADDGANDGDRCELRGLWNATPANFVVFESAQAAAHEAALLTRARDAAVPLMAHSEHVVVTEHVGDVTLSSTELAMQLRAQASLAALIETVHALSRVVMLHAPLQPQQLLATTGGGEVTWYVAADWSRARLRSDAESSDGADAAVRDGWRQLALLARALKSPLLAALLLDDWDGWTREERRLLRAM